MNRLPEPININEDTHTPHDPAHLLQLFLSNNLPTDVTQLRTIDDLRNTEPTIPGEIASVLEYNLGSKMGGGLFVYDASDKTTQDDGGLNILTSGKACWKRIILNNSDITVKDFGAISDGKTDCLEAVQRMYNWSKKIHPEIGIRFSSGKFMLSQFDISDNGEINKFKISGTQVDFGFFAATTLVSDQKDNEVMFKVKARYVEITGLVIDGQSNTKENNRMNTKGFFKNTIHGGQFLRVSCMEFRYLGGRALDVLDTLDCKIDQFYGRRCQNSIVYARWSDRVAGSWDHCTAVEMTNFNIQYNTVHPAFDMPRCTQSIIRNGWIEHTDDPGDLSNGQWVIDTLNLEGCKKPLKLAYARIILMQKNLQVGSSLDYTVTDYPYDRWLSEFEEGHIELENWGVILEGSLNYDYVTSQHRMDNSTDKEQWFYIGEVHFPTLANQLNIKIVASGGYSSVNKTQEDFSQNTTEGAAYISIQACSQGPYATWYGEGSSPVLKVHVEGKQTACKIYVKLNKYTGQAIALLETNAVDRNRNGIHFLFRKSFTKCDAEQSTLLDAKETTCFEQHWIGNKNIGFGYNNNKELIVHGATASRSEFNDTSYKSLKVRINGIMYGIELKAWKDPNAS